jgi:thymidylate synthase (FAD)
MAREVNPEAEKLLDQEIKVLNAGFVRLVDYMGGDARIVQSARVSYGAGTKTVREDGALIKYLMRNAHTSPFEQVVLTFHIKAPIFVARQWVRHRTARMNEISGRYSVLADEFYIPAGEDIRYQSKTNKQGRSPEEMPSGNRQEILETMASDQKEAYKRYEAYIKQEVARELARINLPLSLYTQFYWQIDLHNLFHFLKLRLDSHAQQEIRVYGEALANCARAVAPIAFAAFEAHILNGAHLSAEEVSELRAVLSGVNSEAAQKALGRLPCDSNPKEKK